MRSPRASAGAARSARCGAQAGVHEGDAGLACGARAGRVDGTWGIRAGEHLAHGAGYRSCPRAHRQSYSAPTRVSRASAGRCGATRPSSLGAGAVRLVEQHAQRAHPSKRDDRVARRRRGRIGSSPRPRSPPRLLHGSMVRHPADTVVGATRMERASWSSRRGSGPRSPSSTPTRPPTRSRCGARLFPPSGRELEAASIRVGCGPRPGVVPATARGGRARRTLPRPRPAGAILDRSTSTAAARDGRLPATGVAAPGPPRRAAGGPRLAASVLHRRSSTSTTSTSPTAPSDPWRRAPRPTAARCAPGSSTTAVASTQCAEELARQLALVGADPGALRLLLAAESAGALIGVELQAAGLPWDRAVHEAVLEAELGPRPAPGRKPARMEEPASRSATSSARHPSTSIRRSTC